MRLLVTTYGTEGDTRPMVALCQGLVRAGHTVLLLGEASGASLAQDFGVTFEPLEGNMREAIGQVIAAGAPRSPSAVTRAIAAMASRETPSWMGAMADRGRDHDAIVFSGLTSYVALSVAEHLGIPVIGAGLQPITPTRDFPSPFLPPLPLPSFCNRLSHRFVMALLWRAFRESVNSARRSVTGQAPRGEVWRDYPILFGISPQLVPRPDDWPANVHITGDWPLPGPVWTPSNEMARFLSEGAPPIYIGFGSMVGFDRDRMLRTLVAALEGRRALLSGGWSQLADSNLPANILPIGPAPHERLFPLVSLAVHHGGAGTSHTAARAGIPSVVVPFAGDQSFWANRLFRSGLAPRPVPHEKLDASALRQALVEAESPAMRERAREVGRLMQAESGVGTAVACIESILPSRRHDPLHS